MLIPVALTEQNNDPWTRIVKQSDESVSGSTTLQDDDELVFPTISGALYEVRLVLLYASPAGAGTPDIKVALGHDNVNRGMFRTLGTSNTEGTVGVEITANATTTAIFGTATGNRSALLFGTYVAEGNPFRVQWAQNASDANATIVRAGSELAYRMIS